MAEVAEWLTDSGHPARIKVWEAPKGALPQAHTFHALLQLYGVDPNALLTPQKEGRIHGVRRESSDGKRFLVLATEWSSRHGGLSTLNRRFCRALARAGAKVVCVALAASPAEQRDAYAVGVTLLEAPKHPGHEIDLALLRRSDLPNGFTPDFLVGHGRITGPATRAIQSEYPGAIRLHFIHMAPDEIEWFKTAKGDSAGTRAEERTELELQLGSGEDVVVVTVGPKLHQRFIRDLHNAKSRIVELVPGFDNQHVEERQPPPGGPASILLFGRMEDGKLKGLDIGAKAVAMAAKRRRQQLIQPLDVELTVRGIQPHDLDSVRDTLQELTGNFINIIPRSYTADAGQLTADLLRAKLVLMPSRSEGFGLVGLEAIVSGTPVLTSGQSGLGTLLLQRLPVEDAARMVIPVDGHPRDVETWSMAIQSALDDIDTRFQMAHRVRMKLAEQFTWQGAIRDLFLVLGIESSEGVAQGPKPV